MRPDSTVSRDRPAMDLAARDCVPRFSATITPPADVTGTRTMPDDGFKLTYSTMFDPPAALHERFEAALAKVRNAMGATYPLWIAGHERPTADTFEVRSPIDQEWLLGLFAKGSVEDVRAAVNACRSASAPWAATPWKERVALVRKAASLIEQRVYEIGAAVALEVGKNRVE